jgi:hypothetical protein
MSATGEERYVSLRSPDFYRDYARPNGLCHSWRNRGQQNPHSHNQNQNQNQQAHQQRQQTSRTSSATFQGKQNTADPGLVIFRALLSKW